MPRINGDSGIGLVTPANEFLRRMPFVCSRCGHTIIIVTLKERSDSFQIERCCPVCKDNVWSIRIWSFVAKNA